MQNTSPIHGICVNFILKELDVIQDTIKNLDDIIYKSKNFAFLTWGGSLYLITQHLNISSDQQKGYVILVTGVIPLLFLAMDFKWRKHILQCSMRIKIISLFLNSDEFKKMATDETGSESKISFPFYDPVGWIYTKQAASNDPDFPKDRFDPKYLLDDDKLNFKKVLFYKDTYMFYGTMIALSIILGLILVF
ncbi:MAG: hypothetical protein ABI325_13975 [Ginsengibacter sp.]